MKRKSYFILTKRCLKRSQSLIPKTWLYEGVLRIDFLAFVAMRQHVDLKARRVWGLRLVRPIWLIWGEKNEPWLKDPCNGSSRLHSLPNLVAKIVAVIEN